jgi:N-acetylneuraminic acid mutarotase
MKASNGMGAKTFAPVLALLMVGATLAAVAPSASAVLTGEWMLEPPMDGMRAQAVVVHDGDGTVYVMGGVSNASSYAAVPDAASCDLATGTWTALAPMPVGVRGAAGAIGTDGLVYVFSGYNGTRVADTQIYDPATDSWTTGTDVPIPAWEASAAATYDGRIWVAGGENGGLGDELQVYDPETDTWGTGTALPDPTLGGDMVADGSYLYLIGGSSSGYVATNASYRYYIWGGTWAELSPIPEPRTAHALAIGIDDQIYLAGGSSSASNTGGTVESETYIYNRNTEVQTSMCPGSTSALQRHRMGRSMLSVATTPQPPWMLWNPSCCSSTR